MVAQFRTASEDASKFATIYKTVLAAYEALGYPASIVNTWAIGPHDAPDLLTLAQKAKAQKILEVGTYVGVSTMLLALACPRAHIFTVDPDLPLQTEMGATGSSVANVDSMATTHAIAKAAAEKLGIADRITFVKGGFSVRETFSSTLTSSGSKVKLAGPKLCKDAGPFDFVFIDGLHTSEAVASDLQLGAKHLTASGVMALHDCIGFWGANVRAGVMEFIRRNPAYRFVHPPYADLWRTVGVVARSGAKVLDRYQFAAPMTSDERSGALKQTFGALVATTFGQRDVLEVSVGAPLLKGAAVAGKYVSVNVLDVPSTRGRNLNAELDRILTQFDKLDVPVLFSADLLDFCPADLTQSLLAAIAHRNGVLMLGVTPPGEVDVAGPESRPAAWLVDMARAARFAAYTPPMLDLEPARYSMLPEMRELGRNSQLASSIILAPRGGFVDAKRRKLVELTPSLAAEREQAELQRVHLASGFRRFFHESQTKSDMLNEQSQSLQNQIHAAQEAAQREKRWREENTESLGSEVIRLRQEHAKVAEQAQALTTELAARDAAVADLTHELNQARKDGEQSRALLEALAAESRAREGALVELSTQLQTALEAGQREKGWREEAAALHQAQVAELLEQYRGVLAREAALRAQNQESIELARLESELWVEKEARLRKAIDGLAAGDRERDANLLRAIEAKSTLEIELARVEEERRAASVREASLQNQLRSHEELTRFELEARDERERRLWKNLQQLTDVGRREFTLSAAVDIAAPEGRAQKDVTVEGLKGEHLEERALRASVETARQEKPTGFATIVEGGRDDLSREPALRTEVGTRAHDGAANVDEHNTRFTATMGATQADDAWTREEFVRLAERLNELRAESDEYLVRLVDVYHAMDAFEALVSAGEASLSGFERDVLGIHTAQPEVVLAQHETNEGLDAVSTIAEILRLKHRWQNVLTRLGQSVEAGAARVQRLEKELEASRSASAAALVDIDGALIDQLRMLDETEAQLLAAPGDGDPAEQSDVAQDHLFLLRQRARMISGKIANLLLASESRLRTVEEISRNQEAHAALLEVQVRAIRTSTSWRAMAPVRFAGKPVRVLRLRVGARMRGQELLKLKAGLDSRLKHLGVECPVFDADAYAQRYGDVSTGQALRHYLSFGENEGRLPLATFDPAFYYRMYPDVQAARASALLHFLKFGIHEGRSPCAALHPLGQLAAVRGVSPLELFARS